METQAEIASGKTAGTHRLHTPEARRKAGRSKIANGGGSMLPTTDGAFAVGQNPPRYL